MARRPLDLWELFNISVVPPTQCSIGIGRDLPNKFSKDTNSDWFWDGKDDFR